MSGGYDDPRDAYSIRGGDRGAYGSGPAMPTRPAVGRSPQAQPGRRFQMRIAKVEDKTLANHYIFGNMSVDPESSSV